MFDLEILLLVDRQRSNSMAQPSWGHFRCRRRCEKKIDLTNRFVVKNTFRIDLNIQTIDDSFPGPKTFQYARKNMHVILCRIYQKKSSDLDLGETLKRYNSVKNQCIDTVFSLLFSTFSRSLFQFNIFNEFVSQMGFRVMILRNFWSNLAVLHFLE